MADDSGNVQPVESSASESTAPVEEAGKTPQGKEGASGYTSETEVASLADLHAKAPEVYNAMLKGIAQNIVGEMREHQERLKKMMREARDRDQG